MRMGLQGEKAVMGWRWLSGGGGWGSGALMAHPTVSGGIPLLVRTSLFRVWGLLTREPRVAL